MKSGFSPQMLHDWTFTIEVIAPPKSIQEEA
jgi:hypothetical protein